MNVQKVRTVKAAHGGHCLDCGADFNVTTCPYWHWSKSVAMHRSGSGHRVALYRIG